MHIVEQSCHTVFRMLACNPFDLLTYPSFFATDVDRTMSMGLKGYHSMYMASRYRYTNKNSIRTMR